VHGPLKRAWRRRKQGCQHGCRLEQVAGHLSNIALVHQTAILTRGSNEAIHTW
jgi:hypothetical protein